MPYVKLQLCRGDVEFGVWGLVDSGATTSIFHAAFADMLGIDDIESGEKMQFESVSGAPLIGYCHNVTIKIGGHYFSHTPIAFARDVREAGILGQQGFFNRFRIKFAYSKLEFELVPERRQP